MRKVREVLRLHYECGRTQREIARSCGIGSGTVSDYLTRARASELEWMALQALSEAELESIVSINFASMHQELKRAGVTLQLLWVE